MLTQSVTSQPTGGGGARSEPLRTFLIKCLRSESERLVHREGSGKAENGLDYAVTLEKRAKECSKLATVALFLHP